MPTIKPRVMVTLEKRQFEVLSAICAGTGQPMSGILREFVDQAMPVLERMAVTFSKLRNLRDQEKANLVESLESAQAAFEPIAQEAVGQFDLFLAKVERGRGMGGSTRSGGPSRPAAKVRTPRTNRGVTPHPKKPARSSTGAASQPFRRKKVFPKKGGSKS